LIGLLAPLSALADSYTVLGLSIPVDHLSAVDQNNYKVELGGRSVIVSKDRLDDFLVQEVVGGSFSSGVFPPEKLWSFIQRAAENRYPEYVAVALRVWLLQQKNTDDAIVSLRTLLDNQEFLKGARFAVATFQGEKVSEISPELAAWILLYAGKSDAEWRRSKGVAVAFRFSAELRKIAKQELQQAIIDNNEAGAREILSVLEVFFGQVDQGLSDLSGLLARGFELNTQLREQRFDEIYYLTDEDRQDRRFDFLLPKVVEALHLRANQELKAGQGDKVLSILAHVPFDRRTETTHSLLVEALKTLDARAAKVLIEPKIAQQLGRIAEKDPVVRGLLVSVLNRQAKAGISAGDLAVAESYFNQLLVLRPDPDPANDEIRESKALALAANGDFSSARAELLAVKGGVSLLTRLRLTSMRLIADPISLALIGLIPIGLLVLFRLLRPSRRQSANSNTAKQQTKKPNRPPPGPSPEVETEQEDPDSIPQGFRVLSKGQNLSPSLIEYQKLLQMFGLRPEADLTAIKKAYRNAVKECHPDSNHANDARASEEFIRVTRAYERLLELRQSQGLDR
jgi:DnaJ-domain-containing protein 1